MEWPQDLLELFDDPMFADVKPPVARPTADDRQLKSLQEISEWVEQNGRTPQKDRDFQEKLLYRRLEALRKEADELRPYDTLHILED